VYSGTDEREADLIRTILAATDGSEQADKAISLAADLAQAYGAKLVLLHAVPSVHGGVVPERYQDFADAEHLRVGDVLYKIGEDILNQAETRAREHGVETIETAIPSGSPAKAILDYAKASNIDLIVMGSRGLSDLGGLILGSVSHNVSHLAPCSCVTVR
jgi:nucleotide-binding universal stress UspA family protein